LKSKLFFVAIKVSHWYNLILVILASVTVLDTALTGLIDVTFTSDTSLALKANHNTNTSLAPGTRVLLSTQSFLVNVNVALATVVDIHATVPLIVATSSLDTYLTSVEPRVTEPIVYVQLALFLKVQRILIGVFSLIVNVLSNVKAVSAAAGVYVATVVEPTTNFNEENLSNQLPVLAQKLTATSSTVIGSSTFNLEAHNTTSVVLAATV
jgi:hypothetical protein